MVARNYDKNHLLENSRVRDLFRNLLFNPVESCPPSIRRPQRAVAAWFDNATVNGAVPSGSCYTTVLTVQQIILTLNSLVDAKQPVNVRVSRWTFPASGCRSEYLTRRTLPALLISGNA